ncbi:MAG: H-NS histone family protein [Rubrivivax sp.]
MARTLAEIQRQIDKLKQQAQRITDKDKAGVVKRIREAIEHYGISSAELFGAAAAKAPRAAGPKTRKTRRARGSAAPKSKSPIRYRDDHGNSWTGHGQRPRWFKEAIDSGMTREELAAKA